MKAKLSLITCLLVPAAVILFSPFGHVIRAHAQKSPLITTLQVNGEDLPDAFTSATIRSFSSVTVSEEDIRLILKAGMNAPSALNSRLWRYVVIRDESILQQLDSEFGWLPIGTAAFAILVCADTSKQGSLETWPLDVGFASQALRAQATLLGIESVPCRISPDTDGRAAYFRDLLNIPEHVIPAIIIPFGYPAASPSSQEWNNSLLHWGQYGQ